MRKTISEIQIRYADLDTLGHVNNAVYLSYFELGRIHFLRNNLSNFKLSEISFVIARIEINYRRSIRFDDSVSIETGIASVGRTSVTFLHRIFNRNDDITYCDGKVVAVFVDSLRNPVPVPEELIKIYQTGVDT